ncbi:MAG: amidohydrolase family protein [Burkholderiaceae bacterium]
MNTLPALETPILDAHQHFWALDESPPYYPWLQDSEPHAFFLGDYAALRHSYLPEHYRQDSAGFDVRGTVHVEAECDRSQQLAETEWLSALNARTGLPSAIVAHAWFHTPDAEAVLERQASFALVRGVRSKPVTRASPAEGPSFAPGSMQDPAWRAGFSRLRRYGLSWDLRVPAWHLEEAATIVAREPDIPVALNHTGFPWDRSPAGLAMWRRGMRALAAHEHVYCKLSCLCLPGGPWLEAENAPIVREAIDIFGIERCMFASNFPVDRVRIGFADMFTAFGRMVGDLAAGERRALFHDNAARFYLLSV